MTGNGSSGGQVKGEGGEASGGRVAGDGGEPSLAGAGGGPSTGGAGGGGNETPFLCRDASPTGLPGLPIYPFFMGPNDPVAGQFDNDGDPDVLLPGYAGGLLFGRGNGHFSPARMIPVPEQVWKAAAAGDLDGDDHVDLGFLSESGEVTIFLNDGAGWFNAGEGFAGLGGGPAALAFADLNGDGDLDIAAAIQIGGRVVVALNRGDGSFDAPVDFEAGLASAIAPAIVVADVTGEGFADLVVARQDGAAVGVFVGHDDGTFEPSLTYLTDLSPLGSQGFTSLVGADFDDDGAFDLAIAREDTAEVTVLSNDGTGELTPLVSYPVSEGPRGLLATDLDGTKGIDLVVASGASGHVNVLLNAGSGDLEPAAVYVAGPWPGGLAVADLNDDQAPDLIVANEEPSWVSSSYTETTGATVLFNVGDGTFSSEPTYPVGDGPYAMSAADLDADGQLDLVVANRDSNDVSVVLSESDALGDSIEYAVGVQPIAVVVLDADGDGALDVATANAGSNSLSVRLNDGHGVLGTAASYPAGNEPSALAVGDFNGDGAMDLAVTTRGAGNVGVLFNDGEGFFDAPIEYETGVEPIALAVADLTGDGALDLAIANQGSKSVTVLANVGDGSFELLEEKHLGPDPSFGYTPSAIAAADLSGDGNVDLITANAENGTVTVLTNYGGTFTGPTVIDVEEGVNSLSVADLDSDGERDLVLTSASGVTFALRGQGNGSLDASVSEYFRSGAQSRAVTPGDFNGDGRLDLAVANPGPEDNVVRVLLSTCLEPPTRPAPAAGFRVDILPSATCVIGLDPARDQLGTPPPDEGRTAGEPQGTPVVDGGDPATAISCAVAGSPSSGFRLRANISTGLTLDAPTLDGEGEATASLTFFSVALGKDYVTNLGETLSSSTCSIEAIEHDGGSGIEPGAIWARFSCLGMVGSASPTPSNCDVTGEILLANCDPG